MRKSYLILLSALLASCSMVDTSEESEEGKVKLSTGELTPEAYVPGGMESNLPGDRTRMSANREKELLSLVPEDEISYTDPDNPTEGLEEIDEAFMRKKATTQRWGQSYSNALREARRSGKAVLIWFHDTKISPSSNLLGKEVLTNQDFLNWASDHLVFLCYDRHAKYAPEERLNQYGLRVSPKAIQTSKENYVDKMFDRFNVRGAPTLAVISADGQKIDSWLGYKTGSSKLVIERIENDVKIAKEKFTAFKSALAPQGYREWKGRNGSSVFAKFTRYDEKKSDVWLREFDGTQTRTKLASLLSEDQQWVLDEIQRRKREKNRSL